jgi:uncharacterized OB-fold protein
MTPPLPVIDDENRRYWEALARHDLCLQQCHDCGAWQTPVALRCRSCLGDDLEWKETSGRGEVYSFVIYHQAFDPAFKDGLPYNVAIVALDEGPRVVANVIGCDHADLRIGMAVEVAFDDLQEGVTLARFRPVGGG